MNGHQSYGPLSNAPRSDLRVTLPGVGRFSRYSLEQAFVRRRLVGPMKALRYKRLRRRYRREDRLGDIKARRDQVRSLIRHLSGLLKPGTAEATAEERVSDLAQLCIACLETSSDRAILIERQIDRRDFVGGLHDAYHETGEMLRAQYNSAVRAAKALANAVASLISSRLPHDQRRGLRDGSFGKLYGSFAKTEGPRDAEPRRSVRELVLTYGGLFESVIHEYRDAVLEHPLTGSEPDTATRMLADDRVDFFRDAGKRPGGSANEDDEPDLRPGHWLLLEHRYGRKKAGHVFYLHVAPTEELSAGHHLHAGQVIGHRVDPGGGHFTRYDPHTHEFPSRDLPDVCVPCCGVSGGGGP